MFKKPKKDSLVYRTLGSFDSPVLGTILDFPRVKFCDSLVHRTLGSFDSPVLGTVLDHQKINYCDSPVHRTPGSHFKMPITQPIGKKNRNGPRTCLMGPGGVVWGKKPSTKNLMRLSL